MIKTRTIKVKSIKNEEILMTAIITIMKAVITTIITRTTILVIMIIMIIKVFNHIKVENWYNKIKNALIKADLLYLKRVKKHSESQVLLECKIHKM